MNFAGIDLKTPDELFVNTGWCFGIYGKSGIGKTTLAATLSKSVKDLIAIDCKGKWAVVSGLYKNIGVETPANFARLDAINKRLLAHHQPEPWAVCFDHVTWMQQMHLDSISTASSREWKHYTRSQEWLTKFVDSWTQKSQDEGVHVIFVFQEQKDQEEDNKRWITRLSLTPHIANDLPYSMDYIGYLGLVGDTDERAISFAPSAKFSTKSRRPPTGPGKDIPLVIYHPDLSIMLDVIRGASKWPEHFNKPRGGKTQSIQEIKEEEEKDDG